MKKLDSLQVGRAVAVLSVILYHLTGLSVEYQHGCFYAPWTQVLRAGVDVFFVISGVVMVVTTYNKLGQRGIAKRFLIHRVSRIYPPYLFLTALVTIFWIMHPDAVNANSGGVNLFSSYTLWPSAGQLPMVQVGWTLSFEMMFYLAFFCIIVSGTRALLPRALAIWSVAVMTGWTVLALDSSGGLLRTFPRATFLFSPYVLEFVAGCSIGIALFKHRLLGGKASLVAGSSLFVAEAVVLQSINYNWKLNVMQRVLLFAPPAILLIYGLVATEVKSGSLRIPRWIIRCGDMSYSIYLVHLLVIHFAYRYLWWVFSYFRAQVLFMPLAAAIAITASVIFYKLVEIPFSRWTRTGLEQLFRVAHRPSSKPLLAEPDHERTGV